MISFRLVPPFEGRAGTLPPNPGTISTVLSYLRIQADLPLALLVLVHRIESTLLMFSPRDCRGSSTEGTTLPVSQPSLLLLLLRTCSS